MSDDKKLTSHGDMLAWQWQTIMKELGQVTLHASSEDCPCNQVDLGADGKHHPEYCLGKHLLNINSLAEETALMSEPHRDMLEKMAGEAMKHHLAAKTIYCKGGTWPDLAQWARDCRKKIEPIYYTCSVKSKEEKPAPTPPSRVRYNRGDIESTINAAIRLKSARTMYVYPTANGFTIWPSKPPAGKYYEVKPDGSVILQPEGVIKIAATSPAPPEEKIIKGEGPGSSAYGLWDSYTDLGAAISEKHKLQKLGWVVRLTETHTPTGIRYRVWTTTKRLKIAGHLPYPEDPATPPTESKKEVCAGITQAREIHASYMNVPPDPVTGSHDWHRYWIELYNKTLATMSCPQSPPKMPGWDAPLRPPTPPAPFGWVGGKHLLAKTIVAMMPEHKTYIEAFSGAASVFWSKKPSDVEVLNDKDADLIRFYRNIGGITKCPVNKLAKDWDGLKDKIGHLQPCEFLSQISCSFGSKRESKILDKHKYSAMSRKCFHDAPNFHKYLPQYQERLKHTKLHNEDWEPVIKRYDAPDTFFYLDPPYHGTTRAYQHNGDQLDRLAAVLPKLKGKWLLTYDDDPAVRKAFKGFQIKPVVKFYTLSGFKHTPAKQLIITNYPVKLPPTPPQRGIIKSGQLYLLIASKKYPVGSLGEASGKYRMAVDWVEEQVDKLPTKYAHPLIVDESDNLIGYIAYNGNVFPGRPRDWKPGLKPLYSPIGLRPTPPTTPPQGEVGLGLAQSINEEAQAADIYRSRAAIADQTTADLYYHVAREEKTHEKEFTKRLVQLGGLKEDYPMNTNNRTSQHAPVPPQTGRLINLKHGDRVIINGRKGIVGTVGGYAAEYNEDPFKAIAREKERGHLLYWVNQEATVLSGDPGYYERYKTEWADAIELHDGQQVWMDGQLLTAKYLGNYSDMVHFTPANSPTPPATAHKPIYLEPYVFRYCRDSLKGASPDAIVAFYVEKFVFGNYGYWRRILQQFKLPNDILKAHSAIVKMADDFDRTGEYKSPTPPQGGVKMFTLCTGKGSVCRRMPPTPPRDADDVLGRFAKPPEFDKWSSMTAAVEIFSLALDRKRKGFDMDAPIKAGVGSQDLSPYDQALLYAGNYFAEKEGKIFGQSKLELAEKYAALFRDIRWLDHGGKPPTPPGKYDIPWTGSVHDLVAKVAASDARATYVDSKTGATIRINIDSAEEEGDEPFYIEHGDNLYDANNRKEAEMILENIRKGAKFPDQPSAPVALSAAEKAIPRFGTKLEACVLDAKKRGGKVNPYAVCRSRLHKSLS